MESYTVVFTRNKKKLVDIIDARSWNDLASKLRRRWGDVKVKHVRATGKEADNGETAAKYLNERITG